MNKYRALFIEESREHLDEVARLIVDIERARGPEVAMPLIDECFRHIHSVKGMAASMGFEPIGVLAHRLEDLIDHYRSGRYEPDESGLELVFRCVDGLSRQVESVAADLMIDAHPELVIDIDSFLLRLVNESLADGDGQDREPADDSARARSQPVRAAMSGESVSTITVSIDESSGTPAVRAFMAHRRVSESARIIDVRPPIDTIRQGQLDGFRIEIDVDGVDDALLEALNALPEVKGVEVTARLPPRSIDAAPSNRRPDANQATVRVRVDILDRLIDGVGELFIVREQLRNHLGAISDPEVRAVLDLFEGRIRDLHGQVLSVRMTPLRTLTDRYPRIVRDLARTLGKSVDLRVQGDEIELDRAILEVLDTPFLHTLRNAVDHGVESPGERVDAGKEQKAVLQLTASRDRDTVVVTVEDDGRGLDADRLRRIAVERGILSEAQATQLSNREAFFLICAPGFSTKESVTDVSGRGVGMDVVRAKIESLSGTLDIESERGRGTRFQFRLPLTLAIIHALIVESASRRFAIPVGKIVAVRETADDVVEEAGGGRYLSFRHALAPIHALADVLSLDGSVVGDQVVVLEDGRDLAALSVERIVGYHEIVVKPLGEPLDRLEWFSGATLLGDGEPILILDLIKVIRARDSGLAQPSL